MAETIQVQIRFTADTEVGPYTDCLYKTLDEYAALKDEDKEAEKQARVDAYVAAVKNPVPPAEPSIAQLQDEKAMYEQSLIVVKGKLEDKGVIVDALADVVANP
jgi:hypothetical protein